MRTDRILYGMLMPVMLNTTTVALDVVGAGGGAGIEREAPPSAWARRRSWPTWSTCLRSCVGV
jgi:hypothetical protein